MKSLISKSKVRFQNRTWFNRVCKFMETLPHPAPDLSWVPIMQQFSFKAFLGTSWLPEIFTPVLFSLPLSFFFANLASPFHVMHYAWSWHSKSLSFLKHEENNSAPYFVITENAINTLAALVCRPNLLPQCFTVLLSRAALPIFSFQQKRCQTSRC